MCFFSDLKQAIYFRDEFRLARAKALADGEGFQEILFSIERLGGSLNPTGGGLGNYEERLTQLARKSSLFDDSIPGNISFSILFGIVRVSRNDAMHQGAFARHLTNNAIKLALILEDAIVTEARLMDAQHFMVLNPICAELWQPMSLIRQKVLANSFTYLPFEAEGKWNFVSDYSIATYLRNGLNRKEKLAERLDVAIRNGLQHEIAAMVLTTDSVETVLKTGLGKPVLVFDDEAFEHLAGIITPFDVI